MTDLARWVAGLTDAECRTVVEAARRTAWEKYAETQPDGPAFRAALRALVPKEEKTSGPWRCAPSTVPPFWAVFGGELGAGLIAVLTEREAIAIRDALNALPPQEKQT